MRRKKSDPKYLVFLDSMQNKLETKKYIDMLDKSSSLDIEDIKIMLQIFGLKVNEKNKKVIFNILGSIAKIHDNGWDIWQTGQIIVFDLLRENSLLLEFETENIKKM